MFAKLHQSAHSDCRSSAPDNILERVGMGMPGVWIRADLFGPVLHPHTGHIAKQLLGLRRVSTACCTAVATSVWSNSALSYGVILESSFNLRTTVTFELQ